MLLLKKKQCHVRKQIDQRAKVITSEEFINKERAKKENEDV